MCNIGLYYWLWGIVTLPVTLPANITSVVYVQMRMIAVLHIWLDLNLIVTRHKLLYMLALLVLPLTN